MADVSLLGQITERIFNAGLALGKVPIDRVDPETALRIRQAIHELDEVLHDIDHTASARIGATAAPRRFCGTSPTAWSSDASPGDALGGRPAREPVDGPWPSM